MNRHDVMKAGAVLSLVFLAACSQSKTPDQAQGITLDAPRKVRGCNDKHDYEKPHWYNAALTVTGPYAREGNVRYATSINARELFGRSDEAVLRGALEGAGIPYPADPAVTASALSGLKYFRTFIGNEFHGYQDSLTQGINFAGNASPQPATN